MKLNEKFSYSLNCVNKIFWIILIPVIMDITNLFAYERIFRIKYIPLRQLFTIKIGFISNLPSVNFLLQDFPSPILQYNSKGLNGILYEFTPFTILLIITVLLIMSFIHGAYLSVLNNSGHLPVKPKDFFILGNEVWLKFLITDFIFLLPIFLTIINRNYIFFTWLTIIFIYVDYSIVVDRDSLINNFKKGISFLFNNLGLTIKMALYFGLIFTLTSIPVFLLASSGTQGIILDIIIVSYLGTIVNKAILEVYNTIAFSPAISEPLS